MYYYVMDGRLYRGRSAGAMLEWWGRHCLPSLVKLTVDRPKHMGKDALMVKARASSGFTIKN
jgi:hypothetical protein